MTEQEIKIRENLKDAGFSEKSADSFMELYKNNMVSRQMTVLVTQRNALLDNIHKYENKLYCLDYLITRLKKDNRNEVK